MKKIATLLLTALISISICYGQKGNIQILGKIQKGEIFDKKTRKNKRNHLTSLKDVVITIKDNDQVIEQFSTDSRSMYQLFLKQDMTYQIEFTKENFIPKIVEVNTHGISDKFMSRGFELFTDITLFEHDLNSELEAYSKLPVAICSYDEQKSSLKWDMNYAQNAFRTFVDLLEYSDEKYSAKTTTDIIPADEINYKEELEYLDFTKQRFDLAKPINASIINEKFDSKERLDVEVEPSALAE